MTIHMFKSKLGHCRHRREELGDFSQLPFCYYSIDKYYLMLRDRITNRYANAVQYGFSAKLHQVLNRDDSIKYPSLSLTRTGNKYESLGLYSYSLIVSWTSPFILLLLHAQVL